MTRSSSFGRNRLGQHARALLHAANERPRDAALTRLLLHNGLRISEAVGIDIADVTRDGDYDVIKLKGKGQNEKRTTVPINAATKRSVAACAGDRDPDQALFVTRTGRRLSRQEAAKIIARLCRQAGLRPLSPHSLRYTFVTVALDEGVSLRDVQDGARHKDPRTTRRYDRNRNTLARHPAHKLLGVFED
jgi:integrase